MRHLLFVVVILYSASLAAQGYFLNGDATATAGNCYAITPNVAWQNGTVWYADQLNLNNPFTLEFTMNFGSVDANGADGMVFVLQTVGTNAIGLDGGGMGFQGFNPSFGIEFDTFTNTETSDLASDHVAFLKNGVVNHNAAENLAGPIQASATAANIEDGEDHIVKITWEPQTQMVSLYFDCVLRLADQNNLISGIFGNNALVNWGFTGATGFYYNPQTVCLQEYYYGEAQDSTLCAGASIQLAAPGNPEGQFSWLPVLGLDNPNIQTPVATPMVTTEYCYTYTDLCNQNISSCITVWVENEPIVFAGTDTSFCDGATVMLMGEVDNPDAILSWNATIGNILSGAGTPNPTVNQAGLYVLTATTPTAGCTAQDDVEVEEIPLPVVVIDSPQEFCSGESIVLDAGNGWDGVLWEDNSTDQTLTVDSGGSYELTITEQGCSVDVIFEINEIVLPAIDLGPDVNICEGTGFTIDAGVEGEWSTGDFSAAITATQAGTYNFIFSESGCTVSDEIVITTSSPPVFDLGEDLLLCEGESDTIQIPFNGSWSNGTFGDELIITESGDYSVIVSEGPCTVSDGIHADVIPLPAVDLGDDAFYCLGNIYTIGADETFVAEYTWSTGDNSPTIDVRTDGTYAMTVSNPCGVASDTVNISFEDCDYSIYAPSAFSPDSDGLNDIWFVETNNIINAELFIYNRWGDVVFFTDDLLVPWTGDTHGGEYYVPDGVYQYQLKYTTEKGDAGERRGHLTVFR